MTLTLLISDATITYMYTWVVKIHDLPVMICNRIDTESLMLTVTLIHLTADRSSSTLQELYKHIAEKCMQDIEVIWSMN